MCILYTFSNFRLQKYKNISNKNQKADSVLHLTERHRKSFAAITNYRSTRTTLNPTFG